MLGSFEKHMKDINHRSQPTQLHSCFLNLTYFYDKGTHLVDEGKLVVVIFSNLSKGFNTISHRILLDKMSNKHLNKLIICWVSN